MNTSDHSLKIKPAAAKAPFTLDGWFNRQAEKFEAARFGWMTIYLTLQSCLGAAACMYILQNKGNDLMLVGCAAVTMASNSMFIAQAHAKWCLLAFYGSIAVNTILLILNL